MQRRTALVVMVVSLVLAAGLGFLGFTAGRPMVFIPTAILLGTGLWCTTQMRPDSRTKETEP